MIVIQQITIDWTKATRSVEGGTRRNAIPKVFVLPFPTVSEEAGSSALSKSVFLHKVSFAEENDFQISEKSQWIPPLELQKVSSNINPWVYTNLRPSQLDKEAAERGEYKFEPPKDRYGFRESHDDFDFPFTFKQFENNLSLEFSWQRWLHYFPQRNVKTSKLALGQTFRLEINGKNDSSCSSGRERSYKQNIYNIHFTSQLDPKIFLTHPFDHVIDIKVRLF